MPEPQMSAERLIEIFNILGTRGVDAMFAIIDILGEPTSDPDETTSELRLRILEQMIEIGRSQNIAEILALLGQIAHRTGADWIGFSKTTRDDAAELGETVKLYTSDGVLLEGITRAINSDDNPHHPVNRWKKADRTDADLVDMVHRAYPQLPQPLAELSGIAFLPADPSILPNPS